MGMRKNNAYKFWHYTNSSSLSLERRRRYTVGGVVPGPMGPPLGLRRTRSGPDRLSRRVLTTDCSSVVIIMGGVVGLIIVFLCILLLRHYRRRARIHGHVLRFVRNAKKSI